MLGVSLHDRVDNQTLSSKWCEELRHGHEGKQIGPDPLLSELTTGRRHASPSGIHGKGNDHSADLQEDDARMWQDGG